MSNVEHICKRCAGCQKTCCQQTDIYVSPGDLERVAAHTGRHDFYEFRVPSDPVYWQLDDDPLWQQSVFRDDRSRRVLKQRDGGDCTFLGEQGCTLPADVRPLVCRLYPYDYDARGIRPHFAGGCPTQLLMPGETLGTAIGMTRADAELWHRQLYAEIVTEQHLVAQA